MRVICVCSWTGLLLSTRGDCPACGLGISNRVRDNHISILSRLENDDDNSPKHVNAAERDWLRRKGLIVACSPRLPPSDSRIRARRVRRYTLTQRGRDILAISRTPAPICESTPKSELKQIAATLSKRVYKPKAVDMTGHEQGRLRVLRFMGHDRQNMALWECLCAKELGGCGTVFVRSRATLRSKTNPTRSCGCLTREEATCRLNEYNNNKRKDAA